jgi:hypothetical protein
MMWEWPSRKPRPIFCIEARPFDLRERGNMPAFMKIFQIDDPDRRGRIIDAIHRRAGSLLCDYEVSILRGEGSGDWDLVVKSPEGREACRILYENRGDLATEAFETHFGELILELRCARHDSMSRGILEP